MKAFATPPRGPTAFILCVGLIAVAYASAFLPGGTPPWGPWLMILGTAGTMTSVLVLGASRGRQPLGALRYVFAATFLLLAGCFALALVLPPESPDGPLWIGLPRRAAILLFGVGLLPVFLLPLAYAFTFDRTTLSDRDLEEFRARVRDLRQGE